MSDPLTAWHWLVGVLFRGAPFEGASASADLLWWQEVISASNANLVSATLWERLAQRPDLAAKLGENEREYLIALHELTVSRNAAIVEQLSAASRSLAAAGIESLPLKGSAYLLENLPGAQARHTSDIDLLVPAHDADRAREVLLNDGYRDAAVTLAAGRAHHHLTPLVHPELPAAIEVHTRVVPSFIADALSEVDVWSRAREVMLDGQAARLPHPTDAAAISFLHAEIVDLGTTLWLIPLREFCDLTMLLEAYGNDIDWLEIMNRARSVKAQKHLRRYAYFYERLTGAGLTMLAPRSWRNWLSYKLSVAAISRPSLIRWRLRAHRLSSRQLRRKYGIEESRLAIALARTREAAGMLRHAVSEDKE